MLLFSKNMIGYNKSVATDGLRAGAFRLSEPDCGLRKPDRFSGGKSCFNKDESKAAP